MSQASLDDLVVHHPGTLISPRTAIVKKKAGALLLDVRGPATRAKQGVISGSVHVPKSDADDLLDPASPHRLPELDGGTDQEIVVFCGSEFGSDPVVGRLLDLGYTRVSQISGGTTRWIREGYPTTPA